MILNLLVQTCISIKKLIFNLLVKNSEQENLIHGTYICPFDIKTFILICWFGVRYHLKCWVFKSISLKDKLIFIKFSITLIVFFKSFWKYWAYKTLCWISKCIYVSTNSFFTLLKERTLSKQEVVNEFHTCFMYDK